MSGDLTGLCLYMQQVMSQKPNHGVQNLNGKIIRVTKQTKQILSHSQKSSHLLQNGRRQKFSNLILLDFVIAIPTPDFAIQM